MSEEITGQETAPTFEVVAGNPSPEELAAVVSVLTIVTAPVPALPDNEPHMGGWRSYWRTVRRPLAPGRGAWQFYRN